MKGVFSYIPTHVTISLMLGILVQHFLKLWQIPISLSFLLFFSFLLIAGIFLKKRVSFTIFSWVFFLFLGMFLVHIRENKNHPTHYTQVVKENSTAVFTVQEVLKPSTWQYRYIANVIQIDSFYTKGKVVLTIQKNLVKSPLRIADNIWSIPSFTEVPLPRNPYQFNYRKYLKRKGIHHQVFLKNKYVQQGKTAFSIDKLAADFRNAVKRSLQKYPFTKEQLSVSYALLLGERKNISKELQEEYAKAGVIHILAISGLHIGIFLLFLQWILKPLERYAYGRTLKTLCIVLLLWFFAFVTGLSASVTRAVTMFTVVAIGMAFRRKIPVTHSVITSMLVLLLYHPMFLFDIGFQLSYLAVFGILWIQPILYRLYRPKWALVDFFWKLFTVSVAAQLGILPLSVFYFHQFPSLFMFSNIVVLPLVEVILVGGIVIVILSLGTMLPTMVANVYGAIISFMNAFIEWVAKQESFFIEAISFSLSLLLTSYLCLLFGISFFRKKSPKNSLSFLGSLVLFSTVVLYEKYRKTSTNELLIFHQYKRTVIGKKTGDRLTVYSDIDTLKRGLPKFLSSYKTYENIKKIEYQSTIPNVLFFQKIPVLLIDRSGVYLSKKVQNPVLLLRQSPQINLKRLVQDIQPYRIIADGSNDKNKKLAWREICKKNGVPFCDTEIEGAQRIRGKE